MLRIKNNEISKMINKSPGAISHIKNTNKDLYEVLQLGAIIKRECIKKEELIKLIDLHKQFNKSN